MGLTGNVLIFGAVLVVACFWCPQSHAEELRRHALDCMSLPSEQELIDPKGYHQALRKALKNIVENVNMGQEPEHLMESITLYGEQNWSSRHEGFWRMFAELAETKNIERCPEWLIVDLKHALSQLDDEVFGQFESILRHYMPKRFRVCAERFQDDLGGHEAFREYIPMSRVFKAAGRLSTKSGDEKLFEYLKHVKLPSSVADKQLDLKKMAKAIEFFVPASGKSKARQVGDFLNSKCAKLHSDKQISLDLDALNLVNAFENKLPLENYTRIFNEFHRICLAWEKPEVRAETLKAFEKK